MDDEQAPEMPRHEYDIVEDIYEAYRRHRIANEPSHPDLQPPPWSRLDQARRARFLAIARHVRSTYHEFKSFAERQSERRAEAEKEREAAQAESDRLRRELKLARWGHVSDDALDAQRARYEAVQEEIEAHDGRWGRFVDDMISDIDQLRQQRDQLARFKAAVDATMKAWRERDRWLLEHEDLGAAMRPDEFEAAVARWPELLDGWDAGRRSVTDP